MAAKSLCSPHCDHGDGVLGGSEHLAAAVRAQARLQAIDGGNREAVDDSGKTPAGAAGVPWIASPRVV